MKYQNHILLALIMCLSSFFGKHQLAAQQINGIVYDSTALQVLEFVNILDLNTGKGAITNSEGYFELNVETPTTLRYSFLGYNPKEVKYKNTDSNESIEILLSSSSLQFNEVVLEAERLNLGKQIVKRIIKEKKGRAIPKEFQSEVYQQTTMTRYLPEKERDSITLDSYRVEYLNEIAATQFVQGQDYKKIIKAEIKQTADKQLKRFTPMTTGNNFKGSNQFTTYNPLEYFVTPEDFDIDIYDNSFKNKTLSDRPITSPLANTALSNYTYRLKKMDFIAEDTIFTIAVIPLFKGAPLWTGTLEVHSSDYRVTKTDLYYSPGINGFDSLNLKLVYNNENGYNIPTEKRIHYKAKLGRKDFTVKSTYRTSDYIFNSTFKANFFNAEKVRYTEQALKPNADLMLEYRGVALEKDLKVFFTEQDSIYRSITSDEYLQEQDSIFNKITWRKIALEGFGKRKRARGLTYTFNPILASFQAFGVDGFRITPGGTVAKEFPNSNELDLIYNLNYGLTNNDIRGRGRLGFTFLPQKFARIYVGGGNVFELITFFQSLDAIISRSNFVNNRFGEIGYSMELVNGLYMNSSIAYSDKQSVANLTTNAFSEFLFGSQETAFDFDRYRIFSFEADLIYRFGQQFVTRGRKKILLPNNNPVLQLSYRKGVPGIGNSEVNFDYLELRLTHKLPTLKVGSLNYQVRAGSFINKNKLRQLEYNFFRGSTPYFFTNPLQDLLEIGETRSTADAFFQASGIHHFDGFFLDKIPFISKLQMELLTGGGTLLIPEENLYHVELYAGIGKKIKILGETMQLAVYAVTADNNLTATSINYKIGLNFYNAFAREWLY